MNIFVPKETTPGERRVALVPDAVSSLVKSGITVLVESGAGSEASFTDDVYIKAGAQMVKEASNGYSQAQVVLKVQKPSSNEVGLLPLRCLLIGFLSPPANPDLVKRLAEKQVTAFSMDAIPRIARAQMMDALSSQSTVAGYKAVLLAASSLPKFFPMMTTAAGTIAPAKVLVLGAGVAGLQAIATARRLGAVVEAFDVRPAVKEQVQSLGAKFVEMEIQEQTEDTSGYARQVSEDTHRRELELIQKHAREADIVISTALVPGSRAPILITEAAVKEMRTGSVVVDLAAEAGGNCELTEPGQTVVKNGVTIHGPLNVPSSMPLHASQMYSRNLYNLLRLLTKDGQINLDFNDDIVKGCCITHEGQILHGPTRAAVENVREARP
jgi:NAD(P) transhydrogenase subunit alpha